eukprot:CAMPEP_0116089964 /NCGR_PEP_ID=MMETSP0327-20121206/6700_1 /TAXON_ID=44447 /ORGANISM="Pseudo-nitzschia delicatissima, Strain B596" /LENGTH=296 /DNA_ID=CAMNT_0003581179 /DNA_START=33 /DNA_END=923 /DNA_ORIENTATION=-
MAPAMATRRLREELIKLKTQPPPGIIAEPDESNILKWFYVIRGPSDTPYEGGLYIGKLIFPSEYPMKAPSIHMLTPSGRFQINTKICMSMSDFHPESWNPMWSVATIIQGIQSFMASDELTTGGLRDSEANRKKFAAVSLSYNQKNYPNLFDGDIEGALETASQACQKAEEEATKSNTAEEKASRRSRRAAKKTESSEPDEPSKEPEQDKQINNDNNNNNNNNNGSEQKLSRRQRRLMAQKAAEEQPDEQETNNEEEEPEVAELTKELSEAEIEKRRKRNAKKRAKQKAKKAAEST